MDFSGRHYPKDLILQTVRWYLRYSLSYRDMEEILEERGVEIDQYRCDLNEEPGGKAGKPKIGIRQIKYLNNLVEQDYRGIKRRTKPMPGFQSFKTPGEP